MSEVGHIFPNDAAKQVVDVGKAIEKTDDQLIKFTADTEKLINLLNTQGTSLSALLSHYEKVKKGTQELDKVGKQLVQSEEKLKQVQDERTKKVIENRVETQKLTKEIKDKIKASQSDKLVTEAQNGAYDKIAKSLSSNIAKWKQMTKEERENSKAGKQLLATIQSQDRELKKLDTQIGRSQRHVGNYGKALGGVARNLLGAFGVVGGVAMFARVMKDAFSTIRSFTKENAVLAGVLGKTRDEVEELTEQAIALGSIYPITASEVTKLQVSYARLGFTMSEINNLTEATIQGSIALNAELDATATLVGAVVKAYSDLGTADAGKIIDQLTLSTQRSSLSFNSLETALPKVAGAANALNESLSSTLSKLAIAQDATLDASTAGTSLRNIYLEITRKGLTYDEALDKINNSSNKLNTAFDLFGKRGAIVGLALADNREKAEELREEFDSTGDVAERVAKEQMATLDGTIKSFNSSWEKMILGFRNSEGVWSKVIGSATQFLDTFSDKRISRFNKFIELSTAGIWGIATEQQQALSVIEKRIAKSNSRQIQHTLDLHREELENGGKFEKAKLELLERGLADKIKSEKKNAEDKKKRDEKAAKEAELELLAIEREASEKAAKERKKAEEKANKEIEAERKRHYEKLRETNKEFVDKENGKRIAEDKRIREERAEILDSTNQLQIEKLQEGIGQRAEVAAQAAQEQKEFEQQKADEIVSIATAMGDSLGALVGGQIKTFKDFSKEILLIALDALEKQILITQTAILAKDIATKGFLGVATAAAKIALIKAAFSGVKGLIMAFEEGTHGKANTPSEFIAGESGRELMKLNTGKLMMVDKATHFKGDKYSGATIWSNPETEKIIAQSGNSNNFVFDTSDLKSEMIAVRKAIQKKPVSITDTSGRVIGKQSGNYREIYLERLQNGR
jgi:predicted DNA repair protein MutK